VTGGPTWQVAEFGDAALLAKAVGTSAEHRWQAVQRLADVLETDGRVTDLVATYDSLLVEFDCERATHSELALAIRQAAAPPGLDPLGVESRTFHIPFVCGGEHGPDLPSVSEELAYRPGDRFRFVAIEPDRWDDYADRALAAQDG
jgi:allophanate hydrolase subunit 1